MKTNLEWCEPHGWSRRHGRSRKIFACPNFSRSLFRLLKRIFIIFILKLMPYSSVLRISPWKKTRSGLIGRAWGITPRKTGCEIRRNMTERAGILPYYTNHSLRATTVTILSSNNVETRQIKVVTGHKSDASIESYCERPTLYQFKSMSSALNSFIHGSENTPAVYLSSDWSFTSPPAR